ncbi:MAG: NusG domain II-containing protein [Firmicutes bacterium]|nr:NusG domain II-containing protein [Bacillota bacterium]
MKKGDALLLIAISVTVALTLALGHILTPRMGGSAASRLAVTIKVDGRMYRTMPLEPVGHKTFKIRTKRGGYALLEMRDGKIRIAESNCPEQVCVRTGWISRPGQSIICVPNRVMVYINDMDESDHGQAGQGSSEDGVDVIVY